MIDRRQTGPRLFEDVPQDAPKRAPFATFLADYLILLAAWTITIKFLFPIAFSLFEGSPLTSHVYWDFWWVVHLWLAWALLTWRSYAPLLAITVAAVEILIVITKLAWFLAAPEWTIWTTNWFINKLFVLACFCLMLPYFALHRHAGTAAAPRGKLARGRPAD